MMGDILKKAWLTPCEVAEYLNISKRTVYRLTDDGDLRAIKIRGSLRIEVNSLRRMIHEAEQDQALKIL